MSGGNGMFCLHYNMTNFINSNSLIKCRFKNKTKPRQTTTSMSKQQQVTFFHNHSVKQSNISKLKRCYLAIIAIVSILPLVASASSNVVQKNFILEQIYPSSNNYSHNENNSHQRGQLQAVHLQTRPQFPATMAKLVKLSHIDRAFNFPANQSNNQAPRGSYSHSKRLNSTNIHLQTSYKHVVGNQLPTLPIVSNIKLFEQVNQQNKKASQISDKVCIGTSNLMTSAVHDKADHYQNLAERYINCTFVIGNLEISWIDEGADLSFLESIREITGFMLIAHVNVEKIKMPNLQIIRGRDLFKYRVSHDQKEHEFALILIENQLKSLELPNLKEILAGNFGSYFNNNLCFVNTIIWDEIINWPPYRSMFAINASQPECPPCDSSCLGGCWGEGAQLCQTTSTKKDCSAVCNQGRCFGSLATECCHDFCAGGCFGPNQTDCFACKHFRDGDACVLECPSIQIYNPTKFLWETNPNGKYAFGATCVKECPEHLLRDNGACVRICPPNKRSVNGECVPCGGPCPKNCQGVEVVHSGNIDQLINCTVIEGSITILDSSFTGYTEVGSNDTIIRYKPMHPSRLEVFKTIREITGYLYIRANHGEFKNLSCFKNLQVIGGRHTTETLHSLSIVRTSLLELNLHSLRKVRLGRIIIEENKDLCFADTIDWLQINITRREDITTRNNAEPSKCRAIGLQCHEQCAKDGCWGSGPDECLSCNNYKLEDYCVDNCTSIQAYGILSYDSGSNTCKKCHPECKDGCKGTEACHCFSCKNVKDGPYCVSECPSHKYNNNGTCEECDKSCIDGCTGPSNKLSEGGCNSCSKAIINSTDPIFVGYCIRAEEACPEGYYQEYVDPKAEGPMKSSSGKPVCRKCHHQCKRCTGMGPHIDVCECARYTAGEQCQDFCHRDYFADESTKQCLRCSPECNGCFGPTEADCISCKVYRIYYDNTYSDPIASSQLSSGVANNLNNFENGATIPEVKFNCTAQCPSNKPHRISKGNMLDPYCSEVPDIDSENPRIHPVGSTSIVFMIIASAAIISCIIVYRYHEQDNKTLKLSMHLSGIDDVEPLTPSNLKPNLAPLRSIKETELRKGKVLGSGFGGTVYQGFWYPEGQEHKKPIPVAIKVLRDNGQANMNKEFLNEAFTMASVNHPNLVRLLAVCTTPNHQMLVTQLVPLGCLLDHLKKCKNEIGSKSLLEWCKQIANGMAYLEDNRMVHRDLALRNVLLQTTGKALISDFGLAKFLDVNQSEYHSGGGKVPIKWLAPECIRERKFTHKSDVWAFGVTVWELLTFGMRPFEEYEKEDILTAIEKGARLQQPKYVSAEVYKVMYSCWFYNPDDRPNFRSLAQNFVNFARDPARYIDGRKVHRDYNLQKHDLDLGVSVDDDEDCEYGSDTNSMIEEDSSQPPLSGMPDLTPTTHNRLNEAMFGFEMRHHNPIPESDDHNRGCIATPTLKKFNMHTGSRQQLFEEDMFSKSSSSHRLSVKGSIGDSSMMTDANNNNFITSNSNKMSTNSGDENTRFHGNSCWSKHHTVSTSSIGKSNFTHLLYFL